MLTLVSLARFGAGLGINQTLKQMQTLQNFRSTHVKISQLVASLQTSR